MADDAAEIAAIRTVIDARNQALRAKDSEGVLVCFAEGPVLYGLAPPLVATGDDGGGGLQAWFDTWTGPIGYDLTDLAIAAGDDVAFAHGLVHMSGAKTDGDTADLWFRCTLGLRRSDGAWRITHEHESVPFLMDGSFKAAVDLKP